MNVESLIRMAVNTFMRVVMRRGMNAGIDRIARRGKPPGQMTPEERRRAGQARRSAQRMRQAIRMIRRFGR